MGESFTVNSDNTKVAYNTYVDRLYKEHGHLTFSPPRIGKDRSIDQNSLFHVWLTEYAAHLLRKDKRDVTKGELAGMKRTAKREFYLETKAPHMVHDVVCPKTGERKRDFTSSKDWARRDMFEFLTWMQAMAAHDGLVLESKGEHAKLKRESEK